VKNISIHTVYKPQENVLYLKEWLDYHTSIGVEKFYIYDNAESMNIDHLDVFKELPIKNKYGYEHKMTIDHARKMQKEIIKGYNVEIIPWLPTNAEGAIIYGQTQSMTHLSKNKKDGLVAFIDVDEFIIKQEDFRQSRILQVKYENRNNYDSVCNISNAFKINTRWWSSKCIIDMSEYVEPESVHFNDLNIPISKSFFNHYNHNNVNHDWLLENYMRLDNSWSPVSYDKVFEKMPTLTELTGFKYPI
jgi:hypothetical protein